jgi:ABC-type Fe3+-hydroxamate transport system substrate-binding protein
MKIRTIALLCLATLLAATPAPRVVALAPSLTEDAFAVGANVVAVSKFTDNIPQAKGLPIVADFQSVDAEVIIRLHPDVVLGLPSQSRLVEPLRRAGIGVKLVADDSYNDIFSDLAAVGASAHRDAQAKALAIQLRAQTKALHASVKPHGKPLTVFFALGTGPIWTVGRGSYLDTLIELAGAKNAASDLASPWGEYSEEALLRAQPDVIIAGHEVDLHDVLNREPWKSLRAVQQHHVIEINDANINNVLYRPGPNYNEGLRWLIQQLSSLSTSAT